jgi:large subunit ribosomal protein L15
MKLNELSPAPGSRKNRKRVGRGSGSGHGKTSCRGHKGQKARSGASRNVGFEGGQMPLQRRLPKRGFKNIFSKEYSIINLYQIEDRKSLIEVTPEILLEERIIKKVRDGIKILGKGGITRPVNFKVHAISKDAREKVLKAGGNVELITLNNQKKS